MGRTASWERTSDWVESRDGSVVHAFCLDPGAGLGRLNLGDVYSQMWLDDSFVPSRPNTWQYPQGAGANKILHSWSSFTTSLPSLSLFFPFFLVLRWEPEPDTYQPSSPSSSPIPAFSWDFFWT